LIIGDGVKIEFRVSGCVRPRRVHYAAHQPVEHQTPSRLPVCGVRDGVPSIGLQRMSPGRYEQHDRVALVADGRDEQIAFDVYVARRDQSNCVEQWRCGDLKNSAKAGCGAKRCGPLSMCGETPGVLAPDLRVEERRR